MHPPERTISSGVQTVAEVFDLGHKVFVRAPAYQRAYVWKAVDIKRLIQDARDVKSNKEHFLGSLIKSARTPSPPDSCFLIVDGQQRITTICLILLAAAARETDQDFRDRLLALITFKYLSQRYLRWVPTTLDTKQLQMILEQLPFGDAGEPIEVFTTALKGETDGPLWKAFKIVQAEFGEMEASEVSKTALLLMDQCVFTVIEVEDHSEAAQVFESINGTGQKLGPADLVRNFVFQKFGGDEIKALRFHDEEWVPLEAPLRKGNLLSQFIYQVAVQIQPRVTVENAYRVLANHWSELRPKEIVAQLNEYLPIFVCLAAQPSPVPELKTLGLKEAVERIGRVNGAKNAWPYLISLLHGCIGKGTKAEKRAASCIRTVEGLMVRRGLVGIQNTGISYFFKDLYGSVGDNSEKLTSALAGDTYMLCPSNRELSTYLRDNDVYTYKATRFVLETLERVASDNPDSTPTYRELGRLSIDHIMPQSNRGEWDVDDEKHALTVNRLGNLVLIKSKTNSSKGTLSWKDARGKYGDERDLLCPARLATKHKSWGPEPIRRRTTELANWINTSTDGWPPIE